MTSRNFSENVLRLGTFKTMPWFDLTSDGKMIGAQSRMLKDVAKSLNMEIQLISSPETIWGKRHEDGNWTGIIGMIQRKEADMMALPAVYNVQRAEVIKYSSIPIYIGNLMIASGVNQNIEDNFFGILGTFSLEVWMYIIISMFMLVNVSVLVDRVTDKMNGDKLRNTFSDHFWNILASFFSEATPKDPKNNLNRFLIIVWCLSVLTLMNAFTGHFKSTLTVRKEPKQINSVLDLSKSKDLRILVWKGSNYEKFMRESDNEVMRKVAKIIDKTNGFVNINSMYSPENFEQMSFKKKVAFITEESTLKFYLGDMCDGKKRGRVHLAKEPLALSSIYIGMGHHVSESFAAQINDRLYRYIESGIMGKWIFEEFKNYERCVGFKIEGPEEKAMTLKDMGAIFTLWFISSFVSYLGFTIERMRKKNNAIPWLWYDIVNDEKVMKGPMVNILNDMERHLGQKFDLHFQKQPIWGLKLPNGTWTGFYGMIQQRVVDVILIPTAASSERLELVEFSYPFYTSAVVILAGGSSKAPNNLFGYVMTFDKEVWMAVLIVMVVLVVLSSFVEYFYGDTQKIFEGVPSNIWNYIASFLWEATPRNPKRQLGRLLLGLWLLACLTLMNAFSGQFKSSLMVRKEAARIENIQDLSRVNNKRVLVWKGTVFENIIMKSDLESLRKVALLVHKGNGLVNMKEMYDPENFRKVKQGKTVFITEESTLKSQLAKQCVNSKEEESVGGNMYLSMENVVPVHLYMALSRNLHVQLRNAISNRLMSYSEAGLVNKWINEAFGDWERCINNEDSSTEEDLGLSDLGSVFILWGLSLSFAITRIIWEIIKHKYAKYSHK